jgi:hypothetical protein
MHGLAALRRKTVGHAVKENEALLIINYGFIVLNNTRKGNLGVGWLFCQLLLEQCCNLNSCIRLLI